jgi:hypothetical protein
MYSQVPAGSTRPRSSGSGWRLFFVAMSALAMGVFMRATPLLAAPLHIHVAANSAPRGLLYADEDDSEDGYVSQIGIITNQSESVTGTWQIGNTPYSVTVQTDLDDDDGPLVEGACVEVKAAQSAPSVALELDSKEAYKCSNDGNDDDNDDDDNDNDDNDDNDNDDNDNDSMQAESYGILISRPPGTEGVWVISGTPFTATLQTHLETDDGELVVGTGVEVEVHVSAPTIAVEIESEAAND